MTTFSPETVAVLAYVQYEHATELRQTLRRLERSAPEVSVHAERGAAVLRRDADRCTAIIGDLEQLITLVKGATVVAAAGLPATLAIDARRCREDATASQVVDVVVQRPTADEMLTRMLDLQQHANDARPVIPRPVPPAPVPAADVSSTAPSPGPGTADTGPDHGPVVSADEEALIEILHEGVHDGPVYVQVLSSIDGGPDVPELREAWETSLVDRLMQWRDRAVAAALADVEDMDDLAAIDGCDAVAVAADYESER